MQTLKPKIAISVGDINGVGLELILRSHKEVTQLCTPIYCVNQNILNQAKKLCAIEGDFQLSEVAGDVTIQAGELTAESGKYSYDSFMQAIKLTQSNETQAVVTLPINKEAWHLAGLEYVGHTDLLRKYFHQEAIMMLGCEAMYVALFTEHIPLKEVPSHIKEDELFTFFMKFAQDNISDKVAVLGLNPHAGDNGVLGNEEQQITKAIDRANKTLKKEIFFGPIVPDVAFAPYFRKECNTFIAMYHDQGLAPLKALYFDESVNISLGVPIIRTSVDHGTAFDIAYKNQANNKSYINAIKSALGFIKKRKESKN